MFDFVNYGSDKLFLFLLLMLRASGVFMIAPIFAHRNIPTAAKIGLTILLAILMMPAVEGSVLPMATSLAGLVGVILRELMVGFLIGFLFLLILKAAEAAGSMIGFQVGLIIASAYDPNSNDQVSIIGQFWVVIATLIFMAINGHHLVLQAFSDSYQLIPVGQMVVNGTTAELMIKYTAYVFALALKIAAPITVTLFLTDVALGTVAKVMPQMNIFVVGFPVKIAMGLLVLGFSLPVFSYVLEKTTNYFNHAVSGVLASMGTA